MRVIGGEYRSRVLKAPAGNNTRPTMDNVKEAMFNIIGVNIINANVLDLFSGSGNLGIEALSRGANFVYFNDHDYNAFKVIQDNLNTIKIPSNSYKLSKLEYQKCIENIDRILDLILLDPPYKDKIYEDIINSLIDKKLLSEKAIIVCEADLKLEAFCIEGFNVKEYKYGSKKLLVYRH